MDNWQAWAIGVGVTVGVAAFLRMAKKQQWAQKVQKWGIGLGKIFSVLLMRWLPPAAAEKAEEGIVVTALDLVRALLDGFQIGILADNTKRLQERGKK
jgi:hypothetical protein